jgi:hypothetical protein
VESLCIDIAVHGERQLAGPTNGGCDRAEGTHGGLLVLWAMGIEGDKLFICFYDNLVLLVSSIYGP